MPTLSERLQKYVSFCDEHGPTGIIVQVDELREAVRLLVPYEQAEIAELLAQAEACEDSNPESPHWECAKGRAEDLRAHAAALVELTEAREKVAKVEGLRGQAAYLGQEYRRLRQTPSSDHAFAEAVGLVGHAATRFDELEAASEGGEKRQGRDE